MYWLISYYEKNFFKKDEAKVGVFHGDELDLCNMINNKQIVPIFIKKIEGHTFAKTFIKQIRN